MLYHERAGVLVSENNYDGDVDEDVCDVAEQGHGKAKAPTANSDEEGSLRIQNAPTPKKSTHRARRE